ncbi:ribosome maturation factor RimM [Novispirillum sp. DQ9]|uniref:ribosome maturation factor RimM n=1 Tax=Novispirillum sp. DQ9 TaxID=3398612 RepID=UPI003C7B8DCE
MKSFTAEPEDITAYGPMTDETGRVFDLDVVGRSKGVVLCVVAGVDDRNGAEALRGVRLHVDRAVLPAPEEEDEFYHADLIGLVVEFSDGLVLGRVAAVYDFGAGDVLEVRADNGGVTMVPFTREAVPVIDIAGGRLVAERLPGLVEDPPKAPKARTPAKARTAAGRHKARAESADAPAPDTKADTKADDDWPEEDWR